MRLSAKAEYACVALVELAIRHSMKGPVSLKGVAERYGISAAFLTQIFMQLKGAGLVVSVRGSSGGYQLAKRPEEITLAEVVDIIDGPTPTVGALSALPSASVVSVLMGVWQKVSAAQQEVLSSITLADVQRQALESGITFYQI